MLGIVWAVFPAVALASPASPVCGRTWKQVLRWQKGLQSVSEFANNDVEVLLSEELPLLQRPQVRVLRDSDYQHLRAKFRQPTHLRHAHSAQGASRRVLLELKNGWLFPSGFAANATHHFHLTALRESNCVQSNLARVVGREGCASTNWTRMLVYRDATGVKGAKDTSWLTKGLQPYKFQCEHVGSLVSLIDTQFADYGHFHEAILPRLLWPEVQSLRVSSVIWRHRPEAEAYVDAWLDLLGLSWRHFHSVRRQDVAFQFDTLYLPLVVGLDPAFADNAEITSHTPQGDLLRLRMNTLQVSGVGSPAVDGPGLVVLCERGAELRRSLSEADTLRLRLLALGLAEATGLQLLCIQGRPGGFQAAAHVSASTGQVTTWEPLALRDGLAAFVRARVVLGVHGSLLMHVFVAPEGAHVVDIQARGTYDLPVYHCAAVVGLHYWYHPVEGAHGSKVLPLQSERLQRLLKRVAASLREERQGEL